MKILVSLIKYKNLIFRTSVNLNLDFLRIRRVFFITGFFIFSLNSCNSENSESTNRIISNETRPCEHPEYWPYKIPSEKQSEHPFWVHYRSLDELETAQKVVQYLDKVWDFEVNVLGFSPPLPDSSNECGPDEKFDVFIWKGKETCFVNAIHEDPEEKYRIAAPWGGRTSYMVVDPWGKYGGDILLQTMAHEFNHASHATDDWYESGDVFEMTASYIEQYYGKAEVKHIIDFQGHPDWSILWYDDYKTYYMYGSAIYLYFLRDRYFTDPDSGKVDARFPGRLWRSMRNEISRPLVNIPNFIDGVNEILAPQYSFLDSVIEFARWRYYTGNNDDQKHFKVWQDVQVPVSREEYLPFLSHDNNGKKEKVDIKLNDSIVLNDSVVHADPYKIDPPLMLLGSAYLEILSDRLERSSFEVSLVIPDNPDIQWIIQAVPGLTEESDGEIIDLSRGAARVSFTSEGKRILIITLLPKGDFNPDDKSAERFNVAVRLAE